LRGKQYDIARSKRKVLSILAVDPDTKLALDDVVIKNQLGGCPESGRAMLWRNARRHAVPPHRHHGRRSLAGRLSLDVDPNGVARAVLGKSTWAVLALTLDIELFTQVHYRQSIDPDSGLSELFQPDYRKPGPAHPVGARHAAINPDEPTPLST
jgi:hypothetical protein